MTLEQIEPYLLNAFEQAQKQLPLIVNEYIGYLLTQNIFQCCLWIFYLGLYFIINPLVKKYFEISEMEEWFDEVESAMFFIVTRALLGGAVISIVLLSYTIIMLNYYPKMYLLDQLIK